MKFSQSCDNRLVVGIAAVAVQFDKIREQQTDKIQRVRTLLVTRNLRSLPRRQMRVKFASQFRDLLADAFQFRVGMRVAGEVAQFLDIFFQTLDFLVAVGLFRMAGAWRDAGFGFFFWAHSGTIRTAGVPQIFRAASTQSGVAFSRRLACDTAPATAREHKSNTTPRGPREAAKKNFQRSRASS